MLLVESHRPGVRIVPMRTLGRPIYATNEIFFEDVEVPADRVLGPLHGGWAVLNGHLAIERLMISAIYTANAQTAVDDCVAYARERIQFGRPIGKFQAIAHLLVDLQTEVDCARLLTYRAAALYQRGLPCLREVSQAKLKSTEVLVAVTNQGMQILGGYGYLEDSDMARWFRDARITTVMGGTSQIQRNIIAREMGL
ncbi:MAG: acyl-CoA/acyl-ACP dehydrogenase [Clostridia bacterium]|nr:acyl-CoA/acyl-ACP dehydrogenase [Clostridia bacterium]